MPEYTTYGDVVDEIWKVARVLQSQPVDELIDVARVMMRTPVDQIVASQWRSIHRLQRDTELLEALITFTERVSAIDARMEDN